MSASSASNTEIQKVRAGKCDALPIEGGKYKITANATKGYLILRQDASKALHLEWKERNATRTNNEDDHLIFAGEQSITKVDTGRSEDRVYLLRYKSGTNYHFFWLQEPDASKDVEVMSKIDTVLSTGEIPPPPEPSAAPGAAGGRGAGGMDQNMLLQMLGGGAGTRPSAATSSAPVVSTSDLASVLASMGVDASARPAAGTSGAPAPPAAAPPAESSDPEEDAALQAALAASLMDDEEEKKEEEKKDA